jgi:O-antigen ligase
MLVAIGVTAASTVVVVVAATNSVSFLQERARFQSYDTTRFGVQETGIRLVAHHPLGIGPGQFEVAEPLSAHSTYIRALAEIGLLGLASVLALMLATLVLAARNAAIGRDTYGLGSAPLLGAWSGLLLSGVVIDTLHWRHLWLVAALIWAGSMRRPEPGD